MRLDRRRIKKLEAKRSSPRVGSVLTTSDELERYFRVLENYQLEKEGLPPIHHIEESYDPVLEEYFAELDKQEAERQAALQRREQHG